MNTYGNINLILFVIPRLTQNPVFSWVSLEFTPYLMRGGNDAVRD